MKHNNSSKKATVLITMIVLACILSGCAAESNKTSAFQIAFCSLYMDESAIAEYGNSLMSEIPALSIDGNAPLFTPVIMGEAENDIEAGVMNDPMMGMTGMMKLTAMVASAEVDIVISDMENAARNARGDMFMPLDEILTEDELMKLQDKLLSFDILESDGYEATPTGEKTPICGIDITGNEEMKSIFGNQEIGVFIAANTKNLELAKTIMLSLIE